MGNYCAPVVKMVKQHRERDKIAAQIDIMKSFSKCIRNRDIINAMAIIDEYCIDIDFSKKYFKNGDTPIHYSVRLHKAKFLFYLLQKGYNVNVVNELTGDTPIHVAAKHGDLLMAGILMKFKADINIKNAMEKTPLDIARKSNDYDLLYILKNFDKLLEQARFTEGIKTMNLPTKYGLNSNDTGDASDGSSTDDNTVIVHSNIFIVNDADTTTTNKNDPAWMSPMQCAAENSFQILPIPSSPLYAKPLSPLSPIIDPSPSAGLLTPNQGIIPLTPAIHQPKSYTKIAPISLIMSCIANIDRKTNDLSGWVFKMCNNGVNQPTKYKEHYLFTRSHHLIWNNAKIKKTGNIDVDTQNLYKFNGFIHFFLIKRAQIYITSDNDGYKFILHTHCPGSTINNEISIRSHIFKCQTKRSRDKWVNGINKHCKYTSTLMNALQNSDL
mmetsp:Transcript_36197/g.44673  ORF Transcript_36197/g.44673 Transcript_36197/m.44673 type:complete len:440 (-) Transcript_36197:77-1396(-)